MEPLAMPTVDRGRLDEHQRVSPPRPQLYGANVKRILCGRSMGEAQVLTATSRVA